MAQSVEEIKEQYDSFSEEVQEIDTVIAGEISEDQSIGATSESRTANWRLLRLVWSAMSFLQQSLFDIFKSEVETIANNSAKANSRFMQDEVKIFQYGDPLLWNDETREYYYAEVTTDNQIIDRVAVVDEAGLSTIKVAKAGPAKLAEDELNAFTAFVRLIQPIGSNIDIISQDADVIHLPMTVVYDPIIPRVDVVENVELAVNKYLASLSFNGTFYTIALQDFIQEVEGVIDVVPGDFKAAPAQLDPTLEDPFDRKYLPQSGYIDIYGGSLLADVINYTANNG